MAELVKDFDFKDYLKVNTEGYDGDYCNVVVLAPGLYDTLCNLLGSDDLPQSVRRDIYLTMGYLFYPDDIYPEEIHGARGFIDDIMLILVVMRKIVQKMGLDYLKEHSNEIDYPLPTLLNDDFEKLTEENADMFNELLTVTGMVNESYLG